MHPSDRVGCWLAELWVAKGVWRLEEEEAQRAMCWKPCLGGTSLGRPFWVQMPSSNFLTWELNGLLLLQLLSSGCFPFQVEVTILLSLCWLPSPGKNQIGLEPKNFCIIQTPFPYFPSKPKQIRIELGVVAEETAQRIWLGLVVAKLQSTQGMLHLPADITPRIPTQAISMYSLDAY